MNKHARILIVDDDENIRRTTKAIVENEGYTVDLAVNGKEAIEKTNETAYNIMLLDIRLPDMEGTKLLKLIEDNMPRTRKIMVTGYPSTQNAIDALNNRADAYLVKPVDVEKLLDTIKEQLQLQANERKFSEKKIAQFIDTRVKEICSENV